MVYWLLIAAIHCYPESLFTHDTVKTDSHYPTYYLIQSQPLIFWQNDSKSTSVVFEFGN